MTRWQEKVEHVLPSQDYCQGTGMACALPFAERYQCMLTSVPGIAFDDECFGAFMPSFGCLSSYCSTTLASSKDEKLDFASAGCPLDKIGDRMCDPLCMTPQSAMVHHHPHCALTSAAILSLGCGDDVLA
jgi:hypothetical protein